MDDRLELIGKRIEQAAWTAVAIHLGQSTERVRENENLGQTVVIGGAGPRWFRDEQLPAPIARQGRSSHNCGDQEGDATRLSSPKSGVAPTTRRGL